MPRLFHFRLCPLSRSIRLALAEREIAADLVEERVWEWRTDFLALNPAGELPVLEMEPGLVLCGAYSIAEYLAEGEAADAAPGTGRRRVSLFPGNREDRAEVRRLVDWFHRKLDREVSRDLMSEKVQPLFSRAQQSSAMVGRAPDPGILRAARQNLRQNLGYIDYLADQRRWLAGDEMSFADLAAAAHLSCADYVNEVPWDAHAPAKAWYGRVKSRPSFRLLLADRIPGLAPPSHYANLDF